MRHYAIDVKTRELLRQCHGGKFLLHSQNGVYISGRKIKTFDEARFLIDEYIDFYNNGVYKQNKPDAARKTTPSCLISRYSMLGSFLSFLFRAVQSITNKYFIV